MWPNFQVPTAMIAEANPWRGQIGAIGPRAELVAGQTAKKRLWGKLLTPSNHHARRSISRQSH